MLSDIDEFGESLDEWEIGFVESLIVQHKSSPGYVLTKPQIVKIENIHERRTP